MSQKRSAKVQVTEPLALVLCITFKFEQELSAFFKVFTEWLLMTTKKTKEKSFC